MFLTFRLLYSYCSQRETIPVSNTYIFKNKQSFHIQIFNLSKIHSWRQLFKTLLLPEPVKGNIAMEIVYPYNPQRFEARKRDDSLLLS